MKKRVGVLGLMLTAVVLMLQPATAAANDFSHTTQPRVEQRSDAHFVAQYRVQVANRNDHNRVRQDRNNRRDVRDRGDRCAVVVDHFRQ